MDRLLTFIELSPFNNRRNEHFTEESFTELQAMLTSNPEFGDLMVGTGGCRKLRYQTRKRNVGKSGGIRVVYYYLSNKGKIYLIDIINKVNQENLTKEQSNQLNKITDLLD